MTSQHVLNTANILFNQGNNMRGTRTRPHIYKPSRVELLIWDQFSLLAHSGLKYTRQGKLIPEQHSQLNMLYEYKAKSLTKSLD